LRSDITCGVVLVWKEVFKDRPAICMGIKSLKIEVESDLGSKYRGSIAVKDSYGQRYNLVDVDRFTSDCQTISKNLFLEDLSLNINVPENDFKALSLAEGIHEAIIGFHNFNVSRSFTVVLNVTGADGGGRYFCTGEKGHKHSEILSRRYEPIVRYLLLPYSLRPKTKILSEAEAYLEARKNDHESV
jgi:hypothetical protein